MLTDPRLALLKFELVFHDLSLKLVQLKGVVALLAREGKSLTPIRLKPSHDVLLLLTSFSEVLVIGVVLPSVPPSEEPVDKLLGPELA